LLLGVSLLLNVAAAGFLWKLHGWDVARTVLVEETRRGLTVQWSYADGKPEERLPTQWEVVCGMRPTYVRVDYMAFDTDLGLVARLAAALKHFGTVEKLALNQGDAPAVECLLSGVGEQLRLKTMFCFGGDMTDRASEALAGFPKLENLAITGCSFTGAKLPRLPLLSAMDCSYTPTTLEGLRRIAACPALKRLKVEEPEEGSVEYVQNVAQLRKEHPHLEIVGLK